MSVVLFILQKKSYLSLIGECNSRDYSGNTACVYCHKGVLHGAVHMILLSRDSMRCEIQFWCIEMSRGLCLSKVVITFLLKVIHHNKITH